MLQLYYNSQAVPTGRDFSVTIKWVNPCCFFDSLPGDIGIGITIPVNEWTKNIFGHPGRFSKKRTTSDRTFPGVSLRFKGALLLSGTLKITRANNSQYDAWLQTDIGVIGEANRDVAIPDMQPDAGFNGWKENQSFSSKTSYAPGTDDYNPFLIFNSAFWDGKGREITENNETITYLSKKFRESPLYNTVNQLSGGYPIATEEASVISPYLYFRYVVSEIMRINRVAIARNDMVSSGEIDTNFTKNLLLYHNYNIVDQTLTLSPVDHLLYDHDDQTLDTIPEMEITGIAWAAAAFNYASLIPQVTLKDFIIGIQNYLNFVFNFKPGRKVDIIDREAVMDTTPYDLDQYLVGEWDIGEQQNVKLKFVSEIDKEDRLFGQDYHDLTDRINDFGDPVDAFSDLAGILNPSFGELRLVKEENKIYEYKWKVLTFEDAAYNETPTDAAGWEFVASAPQPFLYGESGVIEEIKTVFSTTRTQKPSLYPVPEVKQQGNISKMRDSWIDFTPRLINADEALNPGCLNWEGDTGLYELRWKKWARFWATRLPVQADFNLPMFEIIAVSTNITNRFKTREGVFIIEEMETTFSGNLIGKTTIRGYKT